MSALPQRSQAAPRVGFGTPAAIVLVFLVRRRSCCLQGEQGALGFDSAEVAARAAVRARDAVAWYDDGQRVGRTCRSHRSDGPGVAGQTCHGSVAGGGSVADLARAVASAAAARTSWTRP